MNVQNATQSLLSNTEAERQQTHTHTHTAPPAGEGPEYVKIRITTIIWGRNLKGACDRAKKEKLRAESVSQTQ